MKNSFSRHFAFLAIALGLSVSCYASQNLKMMHNSSQTSENYYIQPGGVYVAPNGIFVLFQEELIQVNALGADARGVFVPYDEMSRRFVRCPHCGGWYDPDHPENHKCKGY